MGRICLKKRHRGRGGGVLDLKSVIEGVEAEAGGEMQKLRLEGVGTIKVYYY